MKRIISLLTLCLLLLAAPVRTAAAGEPSEEKARAIIEEMAVAYGSYGEKAEGHIETLLEELRAADADAAERWGRIMALWRSTDSALPIYDQVLPDGLPDTDGLCIVVLGFQLEPDGSMREELIGRLQVAKRSAEKYPNALIVCTGGGTAAGNRNATEAGKMAEWLIENGIAPERVIIEDRSLTTAQNAIFTFDILTERYPQVRQLAIVSSDYHIPTGTLLFGAEAILRADGQDENAMEIVSNAAWKAPRRQPARDVPGGSADRTGRRHGNGVCNLLRDLRYPRAAADQLRHRTNGNISS